jgi:hypothetical protein
MAGVLDDKKLTTPVVKNSAAPAQATAQTTAQVTQPKQPANPYTGLPGLSESTQSVLGSTYQASQDVTQAQDYLNSVISGKPGDYSSNYKHCNITHKYIIPSIFLILFGHKYRYYICSTTCCIT